MRVTRVELTPFALPRKEPIVSRYGAVTEHEHLLVAVTIDGEFTGYGEASPQPWNPGGETMTSVLCAVRDIFAVQVVDTDPGRLDELLHRVRLTAANPAARSAVELAVLDAYGRALGEPCYRLLGGFAQRVPCAALLSWGEPAAVAAEAVQARERFGVNAFKLKVGVDLARDAAITNHVRSAVGDTALLYADANRAYSPAQARSFIERTRDAELAWVEEPCDAGGRPSRTRFVANCPIPVRGDETCADPESAFGALLAGASTMISIKPARTAARGSSRIRDVAEAFGAEVLVGSSGEGAAGTFATAAVAASGAWTVRHPAELLMFDDMAEDIVVDPPQVSDGELTVPDGPGFGFCIDPDRLAALRTGESIVVDGTGRDRVR